MKWYITLAMLLVILTSASAHEYAGKVHSEGSMGPCYGWKSVDSGQRICYLDKEKERCKTSIYNHGTWHESEERECTDEDR